MKNEKGFSLVELLVVVIIIAIIAAIAIPNLLASRRAANEASAISSMRTLHTANATYQSVGGTGAYAPALVDLSNAALVDAALTAATAAATDKSGYFFTYASATPFATYTIQATPSTVGTTGTRRFFVNETGVIRANATAAATVTDPPIE